MFLFAGDNDYPATAHLLTPVSNPLTPAEEAYNKCHTETHALAEKAFGLLKSRFRCLHQSTKELQYTPEKCSKIVAACMWLHNVCINMRAADPELLPWDEEASCPAEEVTEGSSGSAAGSTEHRLGDMAALRRTIGERLWLNNEEELERCRSLSRHPNI